MKFVSLALKDAWKISLHPILDERGSFSQVWSTDALANQGLNTKWLVENLSFNTLAGTVRGLHFQNPPYSEIKLVRCSKGKIWDIILDLRADSYSYKKWIAIELDAQKPELIYIPDGCAHGFQTLVDASELVYHMSERYYPDYAAGINIKDPELGITLPLAVSCISERDSHLPDWQNFANPWACDE